MFCHWNQFSWSGTYGKRHQLPCNRDVWSWLFIHQRCHWLLQWEEVCCPQEQTQAVLYTGNSSNYSEVTSWDIMIIFKVPSLVTVASDAWLSMLSLVSWIVHLSCRTTISIASRQRDERSTGDFNWCQSISLDLSFFFRLRFRTTWPILP